MSIKNNEKGFPDITEESPERENEDGELYKSQPDFKNPNLINNAQEKAVMSQGVQDRTGGGFEDDAMSGGTENLNEINIPGFQPSEEIQPEIKSKGAKSSKAATEKSKTSIKMKKVQTGQPSVQGSQKIDVGGSDVTSAADTAQVKEKQNVEKFHNEIEFYTLETRTRVALGEMLKPILKETEEDRTSVAAVKCSLELADERLKKLEYTLGLNKKAKPRAFLEIENNFADFKKDSQQKFNDINAQIAAIYKRQSLQAIHEADLDSKVRGVQDTLAFHVIQLEQLQKGQNMLSENHANNFKELESSYAKLSHEVHSAINNFRQSNDQSTLLIKQFRSKIDEMHEKVEKNCDQVVINSKDINNLQNVKVDKDHFEDLYATLSNMVRTIRYAQGDLFNTQSATDNYIEKYLPFHIQELISENVLSCLPRPLLHEKKKLQEMSKEDVKQLNRYRTWRNQEHLIFKRLHTTVVIDDGRPTLAKRQYGMGGYRQVLLNEERQEYDIKATYRDIEVVEDTDSDAQEDPEMFTSKDHRAKFKIKKHIKTAIGGNIKATAQKAKRDKNMDQMMNDMAAGVELELIRDSSPDHSQMSEVSKQNSQRSRVSLGNSTQFQTVGSPQQNTMRGFLSPSSNGNRRNINVDAHQTLPAVSNGNVRSQVRNQNNKRPNSSTLSNKFMRAPGGNTPKVLVQDQIN